MNDYLLNDNRFVSMTTLTTLGTDSTLADSARAGLPALSDTGRYYLSCSPQIVAEVENYRSAHKRWPKVRDVVRDAVARTAEARSLSAKNLMKHADDGEAFTVVEAH